VTARPVQGMAPYPGQARCLALGFWPECFRRLDDRVGGGVAPPPPTPPDMRARIRRFVKPSD